MKGRGNFHSFLYICRSIHSCLPLSSLSQLTLQFRSPTGTPTTGVPITGLTVTGVTGSVAASGTNVYILCGKGSCSNWTWSGNTLSGGKTSTKCSNIPSGGAKC